MLNNAAILDKAMRVTNLLGALGATLAVSLGLGGIPILTRAVQLSDGTISFVRPPSLVGASTTFNTIHTWGATYYFTVEIPENAGEPLQRVLITQQEAPDEIEFELKNSRAFEGTRRDKGQRLSLGSVTQQDDNTLEVTFDPPIPPGKTVTLELRPVQNPRTSGVYLFGVTAFPRGEKARGQFLGFGRLHFYGDEDARLRW